MKLQLLVVLPWVALSLAWSIGAADVLLAGDSALPSVEYAIPSSIIGSDNLSPSSGEECLTLVGSLFAEPVPQIKNT